MFSTTKKIDLFQTSTPKWLVVILFALCTMNGFAQKNEALTIYVFLSETCPICQSITPELKSLYAIYHEKGVAFVGLFPNQVQSTDETRQQFEKKYNIPFSLSADKGQKMAAKFGATATPQVFLVRNSDHAVLYKGRVDNSFESIGHRRAVVTKQYLRTALNNILQNKPADPAETTPVGCFISKN